MSTYWAYIYQNIKPFVKDLDTYTKQLVKAEAGLLGKAQQTEREKLIGDIANLLLERKYQEKEAKIAEKIARESSERSKALTRTGLGITYLLNKEKIAKWALEQGLQKLPFATAVAPYITPAIISLTVMSALRGMGVKGKGRFKNIFDPFKWRL